MFNQCAFRWEFTEVVDKSNVLYIRFWSAEREFIQEMPRMSALSPVYGAFGLAALCLDAINGFKEAANSS